ncbi:MAG: glycosyltransferase family 9 protein [Phycisphaerae bacterium]
MDSKDKSYAAGQISGGIRSPEASDPSKGERYRITVVFSGALGDTVLLKPMFEQFRSLHPGCRITLVTTASVGRLFQMLGWAESAADIHYFNHHRWFGGDPDSPGPPWADCDWLISGVSSGSDAWAEAARRYGGTARLSFFNPLPSPGDARHVVVQRCHQLGISPDLRQAERADERDNLWKPSPRKVIIHPGSGGRDKCRTLDFYSGLARRMQTRGYEPEFIFGPVECERISKAEREALASEFMVNESSELPQLVEILVSAAVFFGNDSGVSHLAAALGVPTVAQFIRSDPRWWRPVGPRVWILGTDKMSAAAPPVMMRELQRVDAGGNR